MTSHLFGMTPEDIVACLADESETITLPEAHRLQAHILGDGILDFELRRPIRKTLQKKIAQKFSLTPLKVLERIPDEQDQSVRYLFETQDHSLIEAVRIPLKKENHYSVCLSSQVGCAMGCDFCATGRLGLKRNLEAWEIIAQLWQIRNELNSPYEFNQRHRRVEGVAPSALPMEGATRAPIISGAVFMGQGEPFHNYDQVVKAARLLSSPAGCRIDSKNITISTVGLTPQIRRYTEEGYPYRLIISLTSALATKRQQMLPVAAKYDLQELASVIRQYALTRKERVTLAWVLIKGFNTGADEVAALKELLGDTPYQLNIIDVNDARVDGYERASDEERKTFVDLLQELQVPIVRRYSVGNSRHSACGMLAGKRLSEIML